MAPIVCIVGKSDSGKTTLIEKLIPELKALGLRVGTVKHDVHGFEMDRPGKDSWRHKQAGSSTTLISSPQQIGMVRDVDHDHDLGELIHFFPDVQIILTEGYKREPRPKIEIFRPEVHHQPLCTDDQNLVALVTDSDADLGVPRFKTGDLKGLALFIKDHFQLI
jgi:molybdopterin-guanine dinucleotide biosynthesis protein B